MSSSSLSPARFQAQPFPKFREVLSIRKIFLFKANWGSFQSYTIKVSHAGCFTRLWNPLFFVSCAPFVLDDVICWFIKRHFGVLCLDFELCNSFIVIWRKIVPSFIKISLQMAKLCPLRWTDVANPVRYLKVARPSSNPTQKLADFFSISPSLHDYSRHEKKNWGSPYSFFQKLRSKTAVFAGFCLCFNCKSKGSLHQTVAAKKTVPRSFFQKPPEPSWYSSLGKEKEKNGGHRARFCSTNKAQCLLPSLTQLPNVPNKAITNNPVQCKAVASNGLAMAQSVELWTLDQLDRDSLPVQQGITSSDVTTGSSYLKRFHPLAVRLWRLDSKKEISVTTNPRMKTDSKDLKKKQISEHCRVTCCRGQRSVL